MPCIRDHRAQATTYVATWATGGMNQLEGFANAKTFWRTSSRLRNFQMRSANRSPFDECAFVCPQNCANLIADVSCGKSIAALSNA